MKESFYRTAMLLGEEAEERLNRAHVIVFGAGGVGGVLTDNSSLDDSAENAGVDLCPL